MIGFKSLDTIQCHKIFRFSKRKTSKRVKPKKASKLKGKKKLKLRKKLRNQAFATKAAATSPTAENRTSGPYGYLYPEDVDVSLNRL